MRSSKHEFLDLINQNSLVLDIGCGEAGYWEETLKNNPDLRLSLYEPDQNRLIKAQTKAVGSNVNYLSDLSGLNTKFDFIFSFSVLEHVWDKNQFFGLVSQLLSDKGTAVINYDDGHFRNHVYRNRSKTFRFKNNLKTSLGLLWKMTGNYSKFQKPVDPHEVNNLIHKFNMELIAVEYSQLQDFKKFGKGLHPSEHEEIYKAMRSFEIALNRVYNVKDFENGALGSHSELWSVMMSRTLIIRKLPVHNQE